MATLRHFAVAAVLSLGMAATLSARTDIKDFRVANLDSPIAVEDKHPVFSWKMDSDVRGQKQTAYQIQVVRESDGSTLWNTGKIMSAKAVDIPYQGIALQPEKAYTVKLSVWDKDGKEYQSSTHFETSLMSSKISAWNGAKWIGSHTLKLDAQSAALFDIETKFQIKKGQAGLILGANDARNLNELANGDGVKGENYIKVVIDLNGVGSAKGAELLIYRVGYSKKDSATKPFITINKEAFPETNINDIFTAANKDEQHSIKISVETSQISFVIDGKDLITTAPRAGRFPGGGGGFAVGMQGGPRSNASKMTIGTVGGGNNYPSFPNLCSVGFAAAPESEVVYSSYKIFNAGQSEDRKVFCPGTGATYKIWEGLDNITVKGHDITVANSTKTETIGYADPSFGAETMLRNEFTTENKKIKEARLYATSMGIYNFYINGKKVGESYFAPGDSQYRETMGYQKYDVTDMLTSGKNAMGAILAGGWYTGYMTFTPSNFNFFGDYEALLSRLVIKYEDGTQQILVSNPKDWKVYKDGPIRQSSFFQGERYDARKEAAVEGWNKVGYDDAAWAAAEVIEQRDWVNFDLMARYDEPVLVREVLTSTKVMPVHNKTSYIYNMGVNMVGVPSITIPAGWLKEGDIVTFNKGEQLYPGLKGDKKEYVNRFGKKGRNIAGQILYETNRAAMDMDFYIAKGSEEVTIQPSLTFCGYQYLMIDIPGHEGPLPLENVKGLVLSSAEIPTGTYTATTTDNTGVLVNQLFKNIQRSQLGNMLTIPTDCPQRNERMGWTGDAQAYTRTGTYNGNTHNFNRQWMVALRADQGIGSDTEAPGGIGSTVPTYNKSDDTSFADGTTWSAAVCMVPWQLYTQYGDTQIISENIEAMMDWLNGMAFYKQSDEYPYLSSKASGLADWLASDGRTPADLVNNAIYIYMMEATAIMAEAIGRTDYAQTLRTRHDLAKADWNKAYINPATGKTRSLQGKVVNTQASYATPLNFNVFSDSNKAKAEAILAELTSNPNLSGPTKEEEAAEKAAEAARPAQPAMGGFGGPGGPGGPGGATSYDFKNYTITTGFSGTPNILPALSRGGYNDVAFKLFTSTDFPSWLYPVTQGATSMWERWGSYDSAFAEQTQNSMNSFNHFALGAVGMWMYEYQLGITNDHDNGEASYQHFMLQPSCGANYTALEGSYDSNFGRIHSAWTADKGVMKTFKTTIPANTSATVFVPIEDGVANFSECNGAKYIGKEVHNGKTCAKYEVESGTYEFTMSASAVEVK